MLEWNDIDWNDELLKRLNLDICSPYKEQLEAMKKNHEKKNEKKRKPEFKEKRKVERKEKLNKKKAQNQKAKGYKPNDKRVSFN